MNPDTPLHLTLAGAIMLGFALAVYRIRRPDARIVRVCAVAVTVAALLSMLLHAAHTDFVFAQVNGRTVDGFLPLVFGFALLFGLIAMISGFAYWIVRFLHLAAASRLNRK